MPLNFMIGPRDEHDSKKPVELIGGLWEKPMQLSIRYRIYEKKPRIYGDRG